MQTARTEVNGMQENKDIIIEVQHVSKLYGLNKAEAARMMKAGSQADFCHHRSFGLWQVHAGALFQPAEPSQLWQGAV